MVDMNEKSQDTSSCRFVGIDPQGVGWSPCRGRRRSPWHHGTMDCTPSNRDRSRRLHLQDWKLEEAPRGGAPSLAFPLPQTWSRPRLGSLLFLGQTQRQRHPLLREHQKCRKLRVCSYWRLSWMGYYTKSITTCLKVGPTQSSIQFEGKSSAGTKALCSGWGSGDDLREFVESLHSWQKGLMKNGCNELLRIF